MPEEAMELKSGAGKAWLQKWKARFGQREDQIILILSVVIGAITGAVVVAFILITERLGMRLFPVGSEAWRRVLVPVAGSLGMGYLLFRYFPDARGSGVIQAKVALFAGDGVITLRTVFGKFFCTAGTLASGIPLGPEGPSLHVGAGIASVLARFFGLTPTQVKKLIPVGAAAAIAAAFNTPLAAVLFTLEEVVGDMSAPLMGAVVLASATSWAVLRLLLGDNPLFKVPEYHLVHPAEFAVYAVLGVAGGLVSAALIKLLLAVRTRFHRFPLKTIWFQPVAGGLVVAAMGWFVPQVLGVGYGYVGIALNGGMAFKLMALLVVLKVVAVGTSYGSGNAGGIFGPSLFIGAMLGGAVGSAAHWLMPTHTAGPGAYALVGMGAVFAGVVRTPMTSILMIFETTREYSIIVPLMIANLISLLISSRLQRVPIYDALSLQDGIHLPTMEARREYAQRQVSRAMRETQELLSAEMTVQQTAENIRSSEFRAWPVMDRQGVLGVISRSAIEKALAENSARKLSEILDSLVYPHVHSDQSLDVALNRMGASHLDVLPVVSRLNIHRLEGVITLRDVLESYGVGKRGAE